MLAHFRPGLRVVAPDSLTLSLPALNFLSTSSAHSSLSSDARCSEKTVAFRPISRGKLLANRIDFYQNIRRGYVQVSPTELYDILGLTQKATSDEIKATYFKLSKIYHPDVCKDPGGVERFVLISKAYEVLGNEERRREYDRGIFNPERPTGRGAAQATREFTQEEVLRYQEIFNQHHDIPKPKRSQFVQRGKRQGVYDFDEYYKQHYTEEMRDKASATEMNTNRNAARGTNEDWKKREEEKAPELTVAKKAVSGTMYCVTLFCLWYYDVFGGLI